MAITRQKKESIIKETKALLEKAKILVFVNFHGLSVAKGRELRRELRGAEVRYKVIKKTLLKRVLDSLGWKEVPKLEGEVGVAAGYGEATVPPQILSKFSKTNEGLKVVGGVYENNFVDAEVIGRLASIPSREILLGQLANVLSAPMSGLARALNGNLQKLAMVLGKIKK